MSTNIREKGIEAVIKLQAAVGITESRESAEKNWDAMSGHQKQTTMETAEMFESQVPPEDAREVGIEAMRTIRDRAIKNGVANPDDSTDLGELWDGMNEIERGAVLILAKKEPNQEGPRLAELVRETMVGCLYTEEEVAAAGVDPRGDTAPSDAVVVEGVVNSFAMNPERLLAAAPKIKEMLARIGCTNTKGDGKSFLGLCAEVDGEIWGQHRDVEALVCLALGLRWARSVFPREFWKALPGGMPVYAFDTTRLPEPYYPPDVEKLKQTRPLTDEAGMRRWTVWTRISKLDGDGPAVLLQELCERVGVKLFDARGLTPEERVWVLTNANINPDDRRADITAAIDRLKSDSTGVF